MNSRTKHFFLLITFGVVLFAALMNFDTVLKYAGWILGIISPIVLGFVLAFILNAPMNALERFISRIIAPKIKNKSKESIIRIISLILTLTIIGLVVTLTVNLAIPALTESAYSITPLLDEKFPELKTFLDSVDLGFSIGSFTEWLRNFDFSILSDNAEELINSAMNTASSAVTAVIDVVFGIVIAIYVLLSKSTIDRQVRKLVYANLKKEKADRALLHKPSCTGNLLQISLRTVCGSLHPWFTYLHCVQRFQAALRRTYRIAYGNVFTYPLYRRMYLMSHRSFPHSSGCT